MPYSVRCRSGSSVRGPGRWLGCGAVDSATGGDAQSLGSLHCSAARGRWVELRPLTCVGGDVQLGQHAVGGGEKHRVELPESVPAPWVGEQQLLYLAPRPAQLLEGPGELLLLLLSTGLQLPAEQSAERPNHVSHLPHEERRRPPN